MTAFLSRKSVSLLLAASLFVPVLGGCKKDKDQGEPKPSAPVASVTLKDEAFSDFDPIPLKEFKGAGRDSVRINPTRLSNGEACWTCSPSGKHEHVETKSVISSDGETGPRTYYGIILPSGIEKEPDRIKTMHLPSTDQGDTGPHVYVIGPSRGGDTAGLCGGATGCNPTKDRTAPSF